MPADVAGAEEEDVAGVGDGVLVFECFFDLGDGDLVPGGGGGGVAVFVFVPAELRWEGRLVVWEWGGDSGWWWVGLTQSTRIPRPTIPPRSQISSDVQCGLVIDWV